MREEVVILVAEGDEGHAGPDQEEPGPRRHRERAENQRRGDLVMLENGSRPEAAGARPSRVLVVEGDEGGSNLAQKALRKAGYDTDGVSNGAEAVEYYRESWRDVDLVILDLVMPEMNGHDAFRAMRAVNPGVKALLLSGYSLDSRIQAVLDEGALDYLQKPFRLAELADKVALALGTENGDDETR